ncbi:MAG: 6-phosphogluconolactonase [Deltaproteobacteria bacterium]|nr:6-phosphogluconolactonase [Deltaproteobacteria bacterium]
MTPDNILICRNKKELIKKAAHLLAGAIRDTLQTQDVCRFSLAGGTTPGPAYAMLADASAVGLLPFEKIEILFGDERCVLEDHPDANHVMAREAFGSAFEKFKAVHRIKGEMERARAAEEYEQFLRTPIDVQLLGMGPDAHIASLFPGSVAFAHSSARAMAVQCPKPPPWRISVTPKVVQAAKQTFVLATGEEKAQALLDVFTKPVDVVARPAQLVLNATWLVDEAAASLLNLK